MAECTVCAIRAPWSPRSSDGRLGYYTSLSEEAAALLESSVNNHALLDGNKRVGFAAAHTFLLMNGFDLDVSGKAAFEFMMRALAEGKFRFTLRDEWISAHLVPLYGWGR